MSETRKPTHWTCHDEAGWGISCESIEEAVNEWHDMQEPGPLPEEVEVYGYAPLVIRPGQWQGSTLESLLESLDDEYGTDYGAPYGEPTEAMKAAEAAFHAAVFAEYQRGLLEQVETCTVWVADYVDTEVPHA
jgi:hypothetical protein